ncbi:carotenoid biosynthesis protein [Halobacillus kuroshimensis]|uniref:Carotenoid biosynthesis protein n=1 Tax=Halobacillus kuroshimensis TaxID=302481 RepID=A0ABS3DSG6_9BACI|nr:MULTISPECIES: carotenoid biosynthesis protein [Halobacillus]MBN8234234.1 carotenoid biosynthesis protein [Halobacillus kuroshimensis]
MSTYIFRFFIFWYICGVFLVTFDWLPPWLEWANSVFLIAAGIVAGLYFIHMYGKRTGILYSLFIIAASIYVEHLGVAYNFLFGTYDYTQDFGIKIADTPVTIGFAWLLIIGCSHEIARVISSGLPSFTRFLTFLLTGALCAVTIDLILDPVSYKVKEYWIWQEPGLYYDIPFSNFTGWFVTAAFFHLVFLIWNPDNLVNEGTWPKRMALVFGLMVFLFICMAFTGGLYLAITLVALLTAGWYALYFWRKKHVQAVS